MRSVMTPTLPTKSIRRSSHTGSSSRWWLIYDDGLGEQQAKADCERELVTIHRDITEREREAVTQVNYQLLT